MDPDDLTALRRLLGRAPPAPEPPQPTMGQLLADALAQHPGGDTGTGAPPLTAEDGVMAPGGEFTAQELADGLQAYGARNGAPTGGLPRMNTAPGASGLGDGVYRPGADDPAPTLVQYGSARTPPSNLMKDADRLWGDIRNVERAFDYQTTYGGMNPGDLQRQFDEVNAAVDRTLQILRSSKDPDAPLRIEALERAAGSMAFHAQNVGLNHWNTKYRAAVIGQAAGEANTDALRNGLEAGFEH